MDLTWHISIYIQWRNCLYMSRASPRRFLSGTTRGYPVDQLGQMYEVLGPKSCSPLRQNQEWIRGAQSCPVGGYGGQASSIVREVDPRLAPGVLRFDPIELSTKQRMEGVDNLEGRCRTRCVGCSSHGTPTRRTPWSVFAVKNKCESLHVNTWSPQAVFSDSV
jgi:hypothetical protein